MFRDFHSLPPIVNPTHATVFLNKYFIAPGELKVNNDKYVQGAYVF